MFKSVIVYRLDPAWSCPSLPALEDALQARRFTGCGPTDAMALGWVEPRGLANAPLVETQGAHRIFALRTEKRSVPAAAVKAALEERLDGMEKQLGWRPSGRRKRELKDEIILDLLPRAFGKLDTTLVWLDLQRNRMVVGAGSQARADDVAAAMIEAMDAACDGFSVTAMQTRLSPGTAMSDWLKERDAPGGFQIERECELEAPQAYGSDLHHAEDGAAPRSGAGRAAVRYVRHDLDIDEVVRHITEGKRAKRVALSWRDRVAFVLDDALQLRRIEWLDLAMAARTAERDASEMQGSDGRPDFDADVALATGELGPLLDELIEVLGGEDVRGGTAGASASRKEGEGSAAPTPQPTTAGNVDMPPPWKVEEQV